MAERLSGRTALRGPEQVAPTMVWLCTAAATKLDGQIFRLPSTAVSLLHQPTPLCTMATTAEMWSPDGRDALGPGQRMAGVPNRAPPVASTPNPA
jgi:hypothetical protein